MNVLSRMWRLRFLLTEAWGKNLSVISYTIFPWVRKNTSWRERFLESKGYITVDREAGIVHVGELQFRYAGRLPIADIMSILLWKDTFIQKNFLGNSAFRLEGPYETDELQLESGDTVIDIGANIGLFSIYAAKRVGASGRVYACEPIAVTRALLEQNAALNRCDNVQVVSHALGASACDVSFAVNDSVLGDSTQDPTAPGRKEVVRQITLDELVRQEGISHVDCIKADIEGMERDMLAGAVETLRRDMPKLAICIYHKPDDPEVIERLIKDAVPTYTIRKTRTKLFAWCEHA